MGLAGIDTGRLSTYSEAVAADPELVRLRDKVTLDFRVGIPNTFAEVEVFDDTVCYRRAKGAAK